MFGASNTTFGGGFGQQQQQQQQQQQPGQSGGLFGGGGTFGAAPAFGASAAPAFGQQQPAQTGFGGFGASAATPAFGAPAATTTFGGAPGGGGLFGGGAVSAAPAQGGFQFGGGGSTFGAAAPAAPTTSLFGAPKPATTFGGFGGAPAAGGSMFGGGAATGFGAQQQQQNVPGTAHVPYAPTTVYEPHIDNVTKPQPNQTAHQFQSISAMDAYKGFSFEELRWQDYQAGRKQATAAAPAFGASSNTFGQPTQQQGFGAAAPAGGLFGGGSTFGQQQPATSTFGQPAPAGGLFGQQPASTPFGATSAAPTLFGQPAPTPAGSLFGGGGSAFGQPAQQPATTFGGFGAAAAKPASSFTFGGSATSAAPPSTSLFGAQPQQPSSLFGQPQQSQAPAAPSLFGQQQPAAAGGFNFGTSAAAPAKPLFGAGSTPFGAPAAAAPKPGGFTFGATPPAGGSIFGQQPQQQQQPGGFGAPAPAGGLFGGASTFGQPQQQQQAPVFSGGGMFGAKTPMPGGGSLFGSTPAGGGMFGQPQQQQQQQQQAQPGGLFGGGQSTFGSTFGASASTASQPQQVAYAVADASDAYGGPNGLFQSHGAPAAATPEKKKPPMFTAFKGTPINRSSTKITRLRGFGAASTSSSTSSSAAAGSPSLMFSTSSAGTPNRGSPLRLVNGLGDDSAGALSPHAFVSRPNVKKLVINSKPSNVDLDAVPRSSSASTSAVRAKVTFNPELDLPRGGSPSPFQGGEDPDDSFAAGGHDNATPVKRSGGSSANLFPTPTSSAPGGRHSPAPSLSSSAPLARKHGDYYSEPSIADLQKLPSASLRSVRDLVVGREGYGKVAFLEPVDLTTLESVRDLLGELIVLNDRNATVYPDSTRFPKPDPGHGLNVPAVITLEKCWPVDKATREPIKDKDHPRMAAHVKRLQRLPDTEFISFDESTGTWVLGVGGF